VFDVIVAGGGPAGSSAAYTAASRGASVLLLEKEDSIAETVRTSGVTWLDDVHEFEIPRECYNEIRNFSFQSPNNTVTVTGTTPTAAVLDVRKTYRWLASQAEEKGTEVRVGANVTNVTKDKSCKDSTVTVTWSENQKQSSLRARVVIDATGFPSTVCRSMGLAGQWRRFGAGAEYEAEADYIDREMWWLMVGQRYSPAGYAWIFPVSDRIVRIGVGVGKPESDADPTRILGRLLKEKEGPIAALGRIRPIEFHYGLIPNDGLSRTTVSDNVILVGDSAGQANPLVLEGIRYAIRFGRLAGETAAGAALSRRTTKHDLYPYEKSWRDTIESRIRSAGRIQDRWIGLSDEEWDRELDVIRGMTAQEFVGFIKAEFGTLDMVKMATRHPGTAAKQLFRMALGRKSVGGR